MCLCVHSCVLHASPLTELWHNRLLLLRAPQGIRVGTSEKLHFRLFPAFSGVFRRGVLVLFPAFSGVFRLFPAFSGFFRLFPARSFCAFRLCLPAISGVAFQRASNTPCLVANMRNLAQETEKGANPWFGRLSKNNWPKTHESHEQPLAAPLQQVHAQNQTPTHESHKLRLRA